MPGKTVKFSTPRYASVTAVNAAAERSILRAAAGKKYDFQFL